MVSRSHEFSKVLTWALRLFLSAVVALASIFFLLNFGTSAQRSSYSDSEVAFNKKADKFLKRVRQASIEDRVTGKGQRKETSEVEKLRRVVGLDRKPSGDVVSVILKLAERDASELQAAGFRIGAQLGDIATVETEVDKLPDLAMLSSVERLSAAVLRYPSNDRARKATGVDDSMGNRVVSQTGHGIVVGIIDTGIDFRHLDFTVPGSSGTQTRIKAILDMTVYGGGTPDPGWNYSLPGKSALIGHLYSEENINSALAIPKPADQNLDLVKERDTNGHGTHVASTAAGNGLASATPGVYSGIAPEADLIVVKASRQNDGAATFRSSDIVNALEFIEQQALQLNKPFVINLSLGGQSGPHDGTTPDERAIDNLVSSGPGRAVCVAAGNDGDTSIHARGTVPTGGNLDLNFNAVNNPKFIDLYQAHSDRFTLTVTRPDGVTVGPVTYDPAGFQSPNGQASDQYVEIFNANDDKGDADPSNDQPDIVLMFKPGALTGNWRINLLDADPNPNQAFDAWAEGTNVSFANFVDNSSHLISSPGNARGAITVGAFVTRSSTLTYGGFTPYTSPGPTADGRQKPDLEAPGHYLYAARSTDITDTGVSFIDQLPSGDPNAAIDYVHYGGLAGTSMATPVTTGGVALLLQSIPSMSGDQVKYSLTHTTTPDFFAAPGWNPPSGFGQLNIAAAIQLGVRRTYTISGHVTNGPQPFLSLTLSGSQSGFTNTDSTGNYFFQKLLEGGTYTITPSVSGPYQYAFSPSSYTFSNLDSDKVADFSVAPLTYTVGGTVRDSNGNGIAGVQVRPQIFTGDFVTTAADGSYLFTNLAAGFSYDITPASADYVFSPERFSILSLNKNETVDFVVLGPFTLSGTVVDAITGQGLSGVTLSLLLNGTLSTTQSDSSGRFSFANIKAGSNYTLTPSKSGYDFQPFSESENNLLENRVVSFTASPAGPKVQFSFGNNTVIEGAGTLRAQVFRTGDTSVPASVDYRTIDDPSEVRCDAPGNHAYARCDYATTIDTLRFAAGEDSKYIEVPLIDDAYVESSETFQIELMNPSPGLALGPNSNLTMTILDSDVPSEPNPIFTTPFFVRQHYLDFLSREPEAGEPWSALLNSCSDINNNPACDRLTVSAAFFGSPEFQLKGYYVYRFYKLAFNRLPTYSEIVVDMRTVTGQTPDEVFQKKALFTNAFVQRPAFTNIYSGMANDVYVATLMGRYGLTQITTINPAQPDGTNKVTLSTNDLTIQLSGGTFTRAQVLRAIADSDQVSGLEFNGASVAMQYFGYLRRTPEDAGYKAWLNYLNAHPFDSRTMVNGFMNSVEYRLRFGPQ